MTYYELVEMWNTEFADDLGKWDTITEKQKIEFAFEEGRNSGFIQIANIATELSEEEPNYMKPIKAAWKKKDTQ